MLFVIRSATEADREALVEQFQLLNQFEDGITHSLLTDRTAAEASYSAATANVAANEGTRLVAETNGKVVGFLFLILHDDDPYVRPELRRLAHVSELFVLEAFRGRGVARALMAEAERIAIAKGAKRFTIAVLAGNTIAERAYLSFGFKPKGIQLSKTLG
jgi:GNAT superfamily N-acetyltransferase